MQIQTLHCLNGSSYDQMFKRTEQEHTLSRKSRLLLQFSANMLLQFDLKRDFFFSLSLHQNAESHYCHFQPISKRNLHSFTFNSHVLTASLSYQWTFSSGAGARSVHQQQSS